MPQRTKHPITFHGRTGHPVIHTAPSSGRRYIMVRAQGGGTKRVYEGSQYTPDPTQMPKRAKRRGRRRRASRLIL